MAKTDLAEKTKFSEIVDKHRKAVDQSFTVDSCLALEQMAKECLKTLKAGGRLFFCGNGGSASDSMHIAAEFVGRFKTDRRALNAIALTADTATITAVGNDYGYDEIYARQVEGLATEGDILFALSTSGNSGNILKAVDAAKNKNVKVFGFVGFDGGKLKDESELSFHVPADETAHIQEAHMIALHGIAEIVEDVFFGVPA